MTTYRDCVAESHRLKETNDCTVKALAIVTGESYAAVHKKLKRAGRKNHHVVHRHIQEKVLKRFGFNLVRWRVNSRTTRALERNGEIPSVGAFLIYSGSHVSAYTEGRVRDWAKNKLKRVEGVWRVEPIKRRPRS